jgi:hypothetical protein
MVDALESPQEYKFLPHEFKDVNPKEKGGYWFTMEVHKGKAQNNIKGSVVAQDLLLTLQKSGRALEMLESSKFEFVLDKQFILSVSQEPVGEEEEETTEDMTAESTENPSSESSENNATDESENVAEEKEASKEEKEA